MDSRVAFSKRSAGWVCFRPLGVDFQGVSARKAESATGRRNISARAGVDQVGVSPSKAIPATVSLAVAFLVRAAL